MLSRMFTQEGSNKQLPRRALANTNDFRYSLGSSLRSDDSEFDYNIPSRPVVQRALAPQQQQQQQVRVVEEGTSVAESTRRRPERPTHL